jgi:hypothetical protein
MDVRAEMNTALSALIAIILLVSLGTMGLFGRMTPAIERILQENDYSLRAAEEMLAVLAETPDTGADETLRRRFDVALANARRNITEHEETQQVETIEANRDAALGGDRAAIGVVTGSIGELARINRAAMVVVDQEARRLGTAGAWTAVFLGLFGFVTGLVVLMRVRQRLLDPLMHVKTVLASAIEGSGNRRCTVTSSAPDVAFVMRAVNELLDKYSRRNLPTTGDLDHCHASQTVLAWCLDRSDGAQVVVDGTGSIISASRAALEILEGEHGDDVQLHLGEDAEDNGDSGVRVVERFPDADCVLYEISGERSTR